MKIKLYLVLFLSVIIFSNCFGQIKFLVGPSGGLSSPTIDYTGETADFYNGTAYGLRTGYNIGVTAKFSFLTLINGRFGLSYSSFDHSGISVVGNSGSSTTIKNSIFTISLGPEFRFGVPKSPVKPYLGIDLLFSSISGDVTFQGTPKVPSGNFAISSATRTGIGLNGGAEISVAGITLLDVSLKYQLINLMGKSYDGANGDRINSYTSLNDAKDPNYSAGDDKHPVGNNRSIGLLQLNVGVLFGF